MRRILIGLSFIIYHFSFSAAQTLEACQQAAERNYPLIRQYDLIARTTDLTVSNLQKGWLPQVSASAQATLQSDVTAWPDQMQTLLSQIGIDVKGLKKDQYRVGLDVQQTVYDGGLISSQKEVARRQGEVQTAQNEVRLYQVRQRVNELYFGLLLTDEQIRLNQDLQTLLSTNEQMLASMHKNGTATESDYLSVKAERLNAVQQMTGLKAQRTVLSRMLSAFCGIEVSAPERPAYPANPEHPAYPGTPAYPEHPAYPGTPANPASSGNQRPELKAIDAQLRLTDAQAKALDARLLPKLGVFAQGFYGYPGYNMFEDMFSHKWSLNGMIGARLSWNIGALYTRKNDKAKLSLQRSALDVQRDAFLFNNNLEQIQQNENISRYRQLMADDEEIISLRQSVRQSAESKLRHGIIATNDLVREINAENAARVQHKVHEIQLLKEIYDLKYTTGE